MCRGAKLLPQPALAAGHAHLSGLKAIPSLGGPLPLSIPSPQGLPLPPHHLLAPVFSKALHIAGVQQALGE